MADGVRCKTMVGNQIELKSTTSSGRRWLRSALGCSTAGILLATVTTGILSCSVQAKALNPKLKIGIVQRFGSTAKDKLMLKALPGDRLTVSFPTDKQRTTFETDTLQIDTAMQPLAEPQRIERVVLSNHRSFESAETTANVWRQQGVEVEVAQPSNWQVWAKRDRYTSTVGRLLLLQTLKERGLKSGYLDRQPRRQRPLLSFMKDGYRYNRAEISISAKQNIIQVGQKRYAGPLNFQPNAYGTYTLVNTVPLETYLRGVVPYEIGRQAPDTAVQAQAILARTYVLRNLRRFQVDNYELCADTQCQVYEGLSGVDARADWAISSTAGQVLTYNNELIDALYSSTTGGITAPFEDVWEGEPRPYLTAKIDAYPNQIWDLKTRNLSDEASFRAFIQLKQGFNEDGWDYLRWRKDGSIQELNQNLKEFLGQQKHPLTNFNTIQNLTVIERSSAGRVQKLQVKTDVGLIVLTKDEILRAFDAPNSLLFYVVPTVQPDKKSLKGFAFIGGGLGHAVGLSQTGSYALSRLGWPAAQILQFYYPGTVLQPLTPAVTYWRSPKVEVVADPSKVEPGLELFGWKLPGFGLQTILSWFKTPASMF